MPQNKRAKRLCVACSADMGRSRVICPACGQRVPERRGGARPGAGAPRVAPENRIVTLSLTARRSDEATIRRFLSENGMKSATFFAEIVQNLDRVFPMKTDEY